MDPTGFDDLFFGVSAALELTPGLNGARPRTWQPNNGQAFHSTGRKKGNLPSGELTKSYWKWPFIEDFPIKKGDFQ